MSYIRNTLSKTVWSTLNRIHTVLARSRKDDHIVIVARHPQAAKVDRLRRRLPYYLPDHRSLGSIEAVDGMTLPEMLRAPMILELDQGILPKRLTYHLSHICRVDFEKESLDAWELCKAAGLAVPEEPRGRLRQGSQARLKRAVDQLNQRNKNKVYIFGTGKSLDRASERDFSDGHVIGCNGLVRNPALWQHLNPDFVVAADAIYHFGHCSHAEAFRRDLRSRLAESNTYFVYPELFDVIVRRELPEFIERCVAVPIGNHDDIHVDLCRTFESPGRIGNVLNILLLPLACTLSRSVWMWGFDGRAPTDKEFWANSDKHSYPDLLPELKVEHPAFFDELVPKGKEHTYVERVHGDALDQRLVRAEKQGFEFVMMHQSWTHTLNKRRSHDAGLN